MFELTVTPVDASAGVIVNVGDAVSTIRAVFAPNDPVAPGDGSVNVASFPIESFTVPLFNTSALVLV
jgi:hypothetical protein